MDLFLGNILIKKMLVARSAKKDEFIGFMRAKCEVFILDIIARSAGNLHILAILL